MNIIPARYTEVLYNYMHNDEAKAKILQAMSTYPLYERKSQEEHIPSYIPTRDELNNAILNYYMYREIGFETFGRFLHELKTTMEEIMPYYNQMYFSTDQDYDLLYNVDYTRELTRQREDKNKDITEASQTSEGTTNTSSESNSEGSESGSVSSNNKNVISKTPQGSLTITAQNIENVPYADEVTWHKDSSSESTSSSTDTTTSGETTSSNSMTGNTETNGTRNENESTLERVKGNYGQMSYQSLLEKYRDLIINVTQMIINDPRVAELFMLVY